MVHCPYKEGDLDLVYNYTEECVKAELFGSFKELNYPQLTTQIPGQLLHISSVLHQDLVY